MNLVIPWQGFFFLHLITYLMSLTLEKDNERTPRQADEISTRKFCLAKPYVDFFVSRQASGNSSSLFIISDLALIQKALYLALFLYIYLFKIFENILESL